jgi:hypothetical protein
LTPREQYDALTREMKADWDKATQGTPGPEGWKNDPPEEAHRAAIAKALADEKRLEAIKF